ncbi:MAG: hypothetical protein GX303_05985 [Clostridiales bacterium]|nr:hypothetical protein [Clostridiales bacterium]
MNEKTGMPDTQECTYTDTGYIVVNAFTAQGAIPIEGALVTIIGDDHCGNGVYATARTNKNGLTPKIPLPAPTPDSTGLSDNAKPYALYCIEVDKEGYYSQTKISVAVFGGVTSIQPAELSPLTL